MDRNIMQPHNVLNQCLYKLMNTWTYCGVTDTEDKEYIECNKEQIDKSQAGKTFENKCLGNSRPIL